MESVISGIACLAILIALCWAITYDPWHDFDPKTPKKPELKVEETDLVVLEDGTKLVTQEVDKHAK